MSDDTRHLPNDETPGRRSPGPADSPASRPADSPASGFTGSSGSGSPASATGAAAAAYSPPVSTAGPDPREDPAPGPLGRDGRTVRMRTVILGLLLALVAATVVVGDATEVEVDAGAVAISAVLGAGVLLLAGAASSLARERRR